MFRSRDLTLSSYQTPQGIRWRLNHWTAGRYNCLDLSDDEIQDLFSVLDSLFDSERRP